MFLCIVMYGLLCLCFQSFGSILGYHDGNCMEKAKEHWELSCQKILRFPSFQRIPSYHYGPLTVSDDRMTKINLEMTSIPTLSCQMVNSHKAWWAFQWLPFSVVAMGNLFFHQNHIFSDTIKKQNELIGKF